MIPFARDDINRLETASLMTATFTVAMAGYIRAVTGSFGAEEKVHHVTISALTLNLLLGNAA